MGRGSSRTAPSTSDKGADNDGAPIQATSPGSTSASTITPPTGLPTNKSSLNTSLQPKRNSPLVSPINTNPPSPTLTRPGILPLKSPSRRASMGGVIPAPNQPPQPKSPMHARKGSFQGPGIRTSNSPMMPRDAQFFDASTVTHTQSSPAQIPTTKE